MLKTCEWSLLSRGCFIPRAQETVLGGNGYRFGILYWGPTGDCEGDSAPRGRSVWVWHRTKGQWGLCDRQPETPPCLSRCLLWGFPCQLRTTGRFVPMSMEGIEEQVWEPWCVLYWRFSRLELIGRLSHVKLLKHNNMDSLGPWLF